MRSVLINGRRLVDRRRVVANGTVATGDPSVGFNFCLYLGAGTPHQSSSDALRSHGLIASDRHRLRYLSKPAQILVGRRPSLGLDRVSFCCCLCQHLFHVSHASPHRCPWLSEAGCAIERSDHCRLGCGRTPGSGCLWEGEVTAGGPHHVSELFGHARISSRPAAPLFCFSG